MADILTKIGRGVMFYFHPKCTAVAQENLIRKVEETFFQKVALQKGIG